MIKADHKYWARALFNSYIKRLLKKHFNSFLLTNNLPDINNHKLIITPNHFSWWDGFFIDFVNEKLIKRKLHILMLEDQLKRYWFFRKLGAYGFNPSNPKSIIEAVNYTKDVLNDKKNFSIIYPQGEIFPYDQNPISLKDGLKYFIKNSSTDLVVLPIAFKIQYEEEKLPNVYCRFGELLNSEHVKQNFSLFKDAFIDNIDKLNKDSQNKIQTKNLFDL
jgi:1-acyl-sn-glycerol-3-phosphate acyltransferase